MSMFMDSCSADEKQGSETVRAQPRVAEMQLDSNLPLPGSAKWGRLGVEGAGGLM